MKLTINYLKRYTEKSNGTPLVTKNGKPYQSVAIKVNEEVLGFIGSTIYVNDFNNATEKWVEGSVVDIDVSKTDKDGKTYLNGNIPKAGFAEINTSIAQLWNAIKELQEEIKSLKLKYAQQEDEINDILTDEEKEGLPF